VTGEAVVVEAVVEVSTVVDKVVVCAVVDTVEVGDVVDRVDVLVGIGVVEFVVPSFQIKSNPCPFPTIPDRSEKKIAMNELRCSKILPPAVSPQNLSKNHIPPSLLLHF